MRSHFQSQAANKMFCWLCKCHRCVNDFIIVLNHAISCIKTWHWGWDGSGAKTNNVQWLFYVNIWLSVKFWNADVCQNTIKLSCVDMKRKRKKSVFVLYKKRMTYWYSSRTSDENFVLCVSDRIFHFSYGFTFYVFWYDVWWLLFRHIRLNISDSILDFTNGRLLFEISTPKNV